MVLRVCRALVGPVDADDVWSETFSAALRAYPNLRAGSNVAAWLTTITHNKAIDHIRKTSRVPAPVDTARDEPVAEAAAPPERVDDDLQAALDALAPKQRAAVIYHHLAGLPYAEV